MSATINRRKFLVRLIGLGAAVTLETYATEAFRFKAGA